MFLSKQIHTVDPWKKQRRMENPCINYSQPSVSTIPASEDSANCGSGSAAVFTIEKKIHISGPTQFKLVLRVNCIFQLIWSTVYTLYPLMWLSQINDS